MPAGARQADVHEVGAGEAREWRRVHRGHGRTDRDAHRAEDGQPSAVDLVLVRAGGRRAAEVGRDSSGALRLRLGEALLGQDRLEEAEQQFQRVLQSESANARAHLGLPVLV